MRHLIANLLRLETQLEPPLGEAKGEWLCSCGKKVTWTRDPVAVPPGHDPAEYATQERISFLEMVAGEVQKHQRTHVRTS